jgi:hypothetical protein
LAAQQTASRGPKLAVDVASRVETSLPELSLHADGTQTFVRAAGQRSSEPARDREG